MCSRKMLVIRISTCALFIAAAIIVGLLVLATLLTFLWLRTAKRFGKKKPYPDAKRRSEEEFERNKARGERDHSEDLETGENHHTCANGSAANGHKIGREEIDGVEITYS
ncbi:hypothetical protein O6H91_12G022000 [Diphasiastrum complanatum]|uniref:Uncharacterized protein n=2 Tax=Diphasiastrum complanatum TaxID=34168 RepID=A0ACC2BZH6_DIPCM|nr:hypothetical protein O6H91_12G007700 [Diphasiastrum complanatum]KAJ7535182.1 hypothetical protein O6H91_12G022000 [Diphasiastrum complanatum]